ncbi:DUF2523 family protein [Dyella humicola]|uniref:DUF2523 family protein n=1 Tax=Dyella humicola TaxID=2992126 RepID=UPI002257EF07|nr:DUF2523 family protein [Dyella humicola]
MPVVVAWIGEMLLSVVGQMVLSALVSVGIGFAVNAGATGIIDSTGLQSMLGQAGPLLGWVGVLRIDQSMTVILSAWAGRAIVDAARVHMTSMKKSS